MSKSHKKNVHNAKIIQKEDLKVFLCSDKVPLDSPSVSLNSSFSKDTLNGLKKLGDTLKRIHERMDLDGYKIVNGNVCAKKS